MKIYSSEIREIHSTNRDMKNYIESCNKESENVQRIRTRALYISKRLRTLPSIVIVYYRRRKKMGVRKIFVKIVRFLTNKNEANKSIKKNSSKLF